ncbi:MAG: hypothetical protein ACQEVT_06955 [Pseudomonadota bacterium]|uniref:hypothetical protein n=1 Tax=Roseovarius TaxID=74030 RepID=UPI0022A8A261|nr:hypothetical protein [Roseovarius sp. EGI FJ00037]MCZ0812097.1 hypothetical protein [Roseovarius sp. EGI FJ00037]
MHSYLWRDAQYRAGLREFADIQLSTPTFPDICKFAEFCFVKRAVFLMVAQNR